MKYHLITYGCQMNTADSQEMARPLEARGFLPTADIDQADVILMNTCTVRDQAEHRAQSNLGRLEGWKAADPRRVLIVAGCAASRWGTSIQKRYPFIDLVAPATRIEEFPDVVAAVLNDRWNFEKEHASAFADSPLLHPSADSVESTRVDHPWFGHSDMAYVTIMRGCNYACSYCIVPQVRGREKYRPLPEILQEIRDKAARGQTDVMLLGQTVNSYYWRASDSAGERVQDFADLLRAVNALEGVQQIRFLSPHPRHMRDRVIDAMTDCLKVVRHLHLPVQSGSSRMLTAMNRLYGREDYLAIIQKLRQRMPELKITTDIIVGHPGETADDFNDTLSLLRTVRFDGLFAFNYSPRPGTVSATQPDDVPAATKEQRLQEVLALNKQIVLSPM